MTMYAALAAILPAAYYVRRYWLTPWARFVSLTETKKNGAFLTVKHVNWYPPFLDRVATYHRAENPLYSLSSWANAETGQVPWGAESYGHEFHQRQLDGLLQAARARNAETEELLK